MQIISTREFRANQTSYLRRIKSGEEIYLKSRLGSFRISPVEETETKQSSPNIHSLYESLCEVKSILEGKSKGISAEDLLNEL